MARPPRYNDKELRKIFKELKRRNLSMLEIAKDLNSGLGKSQERQMFCVF
jgi:hypothetical protein